MLIIIFSHHLFLSLRAATGFITSLDLSIVLDFDYWLFKTIRSISEINIIILNIFKKIVFITLSIYLEIIILI